ncbi:hypothetical protein A4U88_2624 [Serratia marcescens]|nr:hypothetical protein A4U88_2624 [Serratia marcescens]AXK22862.1 Hypothetical protein SmN45_1056 [Serratia marcescens]
MSCQGRHDEFLVQPKWSDGFSQAGKFGTTKPATVSAGGGCRAHHLR